MFKTKKTLIVIYKDELLINQLKKLVESHDDTEQNVVGTRDDSISIVYWTEKVWLANKKAGNIQGKILFLGDITGTDKLIPVVDVFFDEFGVRYGWAGNQAVVFVDPKVLKNRKDYDSFLEKLSLLPVPVFLKETTSQKAKPNGVNALGKVGTKIAVKSEELFRNKTMMKRQMLFYGVVKLYSDGLEKFMNF